MKTRNAVLLLLLSCVTVSISTADDFTKITRIVDLAKVKANPYTAFIQFAFWPQQELVSAKRCDNRLIENDILQMTNTLGRLVKNEYLPTTEDMKSSIGIPEYVDGDDYLFLRYKTKSGIHVEIQDGRAMYILMSSPEWGKGELAKIESFVRDVAVKTINFPADSERAGNPLVFASSIDVGPSRCGALAWKLESEPPAAQSSWYSQIMWWSDGTRVLFAISKMSKEDYAKLATIANRASQRKPHKFQYRTRP